MRMLGSLGVSLPRNRTRPAVGEREAARVHCAGLALRSPTPHDKRTRGHHERQSGDRKAGPSFASGSDGRGAGQRHWGGPPHGGPPRRPLRDRRRGAVVEPGALPRRRAGARLGAGARLRRRGRDARGRVRAPGRGGRGRNHDPQRQPLPARLPLARRRPRRHLRQAADDEPGRCPRSRRPGAGERPRLLHHLQLLRLSHGPAGPGDGRGRRDRRSSPRPGGVHPAAACGASRHRGPRLLALPREPSGTVDNPRRHRHPRLAPAAFGDRRGAGGDLRPTSVR